MTVAVLHIQLSLVAFAAAAVVASLARMVKDAEVVRLHDYAEQDSLASAVAAPLVAAAIR